MEFISLMEFIGTVAFAVTGALIAIEKDLDYYGISFLAIITAIGGGIIRDIIINKEIPSSLENPIYAVICICTVLVVVIFYRFILHMNRFINLCDAIGLAAFTSIGAAAATNAGFDQIFIIITLALLTGTGGGLMRDVCVREVPFIFEKEVYAVASMVGAIAYAVAIKHLDMVESMYISSAVTFSIRMVCMKFNIHLGRVKKQKFGRRK